MFASIKCLPTKAILQKNVSDNGTDSLFSGKLLN